MPHTRVILCRSNPIAPDPRVEKIAAALQEAGFAVCCVGWDRTGTLPDQEQVGELPIRRLPIRAGFGRGMGNLPQLLRWQWGLWRWLVANRECYDVIHACDFDTILPALWCQRAYHKKVVYDIFDFYADHLRATPGWIKKLIRKADYWAIHRADGVIIVDDSRRGQIAGSQPKKLEVIYNSPQDSGTNGNGSTSETNHAGIVLTYVGLLQVERGLCELIHVLARHPDWKLHLAGFGGDEALIRREAAGLPNIAWYGRVDYQKTLALSREADALFATYDPSIPNHRYSSPNKVFEAMMLGKPLIVARDTNVDRVVEEQDCGMVVTYGNEAELEAALTRLASDPQVRADYGHNARRAYDQVYGWERMKQRLVALYREI